MRILLTGKDGQLGWELRHGLQRQYDVIAVGREDIDLRDTRHLHDMLRRMPKISLIVNCAAYTNVDRAEKEPRLAEQINAEAPAILAAEADRRGIPMIHFSTDYVFSSEKRDKPYTEQDMPNPLNIYGWSKLAGELRVKELCEKHLIFRVSGLYGTRRNNFFTNMLRYLNTNLVSCKSNEFENNTSAQRKRVIATERQFQPPVAASRPRVVDDQVMTPNWTPFVAEAVRHVIDRLFQLRQTSWGLYHLTGTGATTWHEFAMMIFEKTARLWSKTRIMPEAVSSEEYGAAAKRPAYSVMNPDKFVRTFDDVLPHWQTQFLHCVNGVPEYE